ncbi:phosphoglycolate phosphatase [Thermaurantiacus sp.]
MTPAPTLAFDLDGTLVDTAPDLTAALNHALAMLGRPPVPPESVRTMVGQGARRLLERGLAATGPEEAVPALIEAGLAHFLAHYRANIAARSRPFPGADDALDWLAARGIGLAICTNKPEALTHALLEALGWHGRFAAILGADSRPWKKPDPRHLLDTIAAAGGAAATSAYVGDSPTDAATAAAAAVPFIFVTHGYCEAAPATLSAQARIDHFSELAAALEKVQPAFSAAAKGPLR